MGWSQSNYFYLLIVGSTSQFTFGLLWQNWQIKEWKKGSKLRHVQRELPENLLIRWQTPFKWLSFIWTSWGSTSNSPSLIWLKHLVFIGIYANHNRLYPFQVTFDSNWKNNSAIKVLHSLFSSLSSVSLSLTLPPFTPFWRLDNISVHEPGVKVELSEIGKWPEAPDLQKRAVCGLFVHAEVKPRTGGFVSPANYGAVGWSGRRDGAKNLCALQWTDGWINGRMDE